MDDDLLSLTLRVEGGADADAQEIDDLTQRLRQQLLELDIASVRPVQAGEPPPGARSAELLKAVVGVAQGWLSGRTARSVELRIGGDTLEVSGLSSADQRRLVNLFVERHAG